jgi:hypothetical protein
MPSASIQVQPLNAKSFTCLHPSFIEHLVTEWLVWLCSVDARNVAEELQFWKAHTKKGVTIKGAVKRKNTSPLKKSLFFS